MIVPFLNIYILKIWGEVIFVEKHNHKFHFESTYAENSERHSGGDVKYEGWNSGERFKLEKCF